MNEYSLAKVQPIYFQKPSVLTFAATFSYIIRYAMGIRK